MTRTTGTTRIVLATTLAVGMLATACTGSDKKSAASTESSTSAAASPSTSASSTPPAPKPPAVNPLNGTTFQSKYPTIAVKIDDTPPGRPQVGIDQADIVYIEEVEGGLTRLAAIFGSNHPSKVGYVRSTRPSDPDLLLQYGKITEAYSGGAHDSLPRIHRSGITSWSNDAGAAYYSRQSHAGDHGYINLVLNVNALAHKVKTPKPKDIGLRWSSALPTKGTAGKRVTTYVGGTLVDFRWNAKLKKYVRYIDGVAQHAADGKPIATPNLVVQKCTIVPHPQDSDVLGNPSMFTTTVGKGQVFVFRNGREIPGTWSRPKLSAGTTLRMANGKPLTLSPGGAWFALAQKSSKVSAS